MGDDRRADFPPLSIGDLLVLTLSVGLCLATIAPELRDLTIANEPNAIPWLSIAASAVDHAVIGIGLFGLVVLAREWLRGTDFPLSPGHLIIIATAPVGVEILLLAAIQKFSEQYTHVFQLADCTLGVLVIVGSVIFTNRALRAMPRRWRPGLALLLGSLSILACLRMLVILKLVGYTWASFWPRHLLAVFTTLSLSAAGAMCLAAVVDVSQRMSRDWLHYCGLAMTLFSAGATVVNLGGYTAKWWRDLALHLVP